MTKRLRNPEVGGWLLMVGAIGVAAGFIFWLERGLTFAYDEFFWLEIGGFVHLDYFFHPYGGHLIAFPYFIWRGVLELFGASFTAFAVVQVVGLSTMAALVYVYAKRRLGPLLALAPAVVLLFLGSSWAVLLEPMIGIQFLCAVVPGLAAILTLERDDRLGDIAACGLLCLALTGFTEAAVFLVGAIIVVALSPDWKRRAWVVAVPVVGYGAWRLWAAQFESAGIILSNIPLLPAYFVDALSVAVSSLFGLGQVVGPGPWTQIRLEGYNLNFFGEGFVLTVLELLVIWGALRFMRRRGPIPRSFWPAFGMLITLWIELGVILEPGRTAAEVRYIYAAILLLLLVLIEIFRGARTTRLTMAIALALTAAAVIGNLARFQEGRQILDAYQREARADMTVIQLAGMNANQAFTPNLDAPHRVPGGLVLNTGSWLAVVRRYGSSADPIPKLRHQSEPVREEADAVAVKALELKLVPTSGDGVRNCHRVDATSASTEVVLPKGGAVVTPTRDSEVSLRRWSNEFAAGLRDVQGGETAILRIPADPVDVPWRLRFAQGGPVTVCAIG